MKTNISIRYIFIAVMWAMGAVLVSATGTKSPSAVKPSHAVARVGFYHIPGFNNQTVNGERSGYGYDFLQLVRRYSQLEFTYQGYEKSWAESLAMLENGEIDLLAGALWTEERAKQFDYSFPIGTTHLNLYVRNWDERYSPGEASTYNGMRIGTVTSEMLDDRIRRMAVRKHFDCSVVDFNDFESMCKALDEGRVDAVCAIATHLIKGYRVLDTFDNENIYAIVKKGNMRLHDTVNDAILQMDQSVAMWSQKLLQDNYLVDTEHPLEFSEKEKDFIRRHSTQQTAIKIATDDTWKPYSWYEDGEYRGIVVEIVEMLMARAGLKYEFVVDEISSEDVLKTHPEADIYVDFASTKQYAEEQSLVVSPPFMQPTISIVSRKGYQELKSLGLSKNTPMLNKMAKKHYELDFVVYSSTEELISAVEDGEVDGAMMYDFVAQLYVNANEDKNIQISFVPGMTLPLHMVTRMSDERELISIISKCIDHMSRNESNNIATKYLSTAEKEVTVWDFMKRNPWLPVLVLLVSLSGFLMEKIKRVRIVQRKDAQARKLAEQANEAKTSFLFNMSHDIRTPMNAIIGFRDLLEKNQDDPVKRADYLRKIEDASMVLLSIINNVLEMARIEKGTVELDETPWSAEQFSDVVYSIFSDMMAKKGLEFTREMNVEHPYIYGDTIKLREVFINIISNAYKYTPKGGVHMRLDELPHEREGWVYYRTTISDTGMGMSEEFLPRLFEEFSREKNTTDAKIEGTGLGMPIVKRLVSLMNGTIEVKSKKGEGTTFIVTIPHRIAERTGLLEQKQAAVNPASFEGKRILLAEDNDLNAEIAMEILGEKGFIVERAADGRICCDMLEAATDGYYDLVLMDIQMPEMNGYEATSAIRSMADVRKAAIPIVAMTANAFEEDKRNALKAGMNGHLTKPIDMHELMKTLANVVRG